MESQPQNSEFMNNPEHFHPCAFKGDHKNCEPNVTDVLNKIYGSNMIFTPAIFKEFSPKYLVFPI